jgi:hypothetical protein
MVDDELRPDETLEEAEKEAEKATMGQDAETLLADELAEHDLRPSLVTAAALVRGFEVDVRNAVVGAVLANHDVTLTRSAARSVFAGGDVDLRQGGAGVVVAGENATLTQGGAQAVISGGLVQMEQAGSGFAIGRRIRIGKGGLAIFALGGRIEVAEGGRIMVGRTLSMAVLGGLVALVGLVAMLGRRRRPARR